MADSAAGLRSTAPSGGPVANCIALLGGSNPQPIPRATARFTAQPHRASVRGVRHPFGPPTGGVPGRAPLTGGRTPGHVARIPCRARVAPRYHPGPPDRSAPPWPLQGRGEHNGGPELCPGRTPPRGGSRGPGVESGTAEQSGRSCPQSGLWPGVGSGDQLPRVCDSIGTDYPGFTPGCPRAMGGHVPRASPGAGCIGSVGRGRAPGGRAGCPVPRPGGTLPAIGGRRLRNRTPGGRGPSTPEYWPRIRGGCPGRARTASRAPHTPC